MVTAEAELQPERSGGGMISRIACTLCIMVAMSLSAGATAAPTTQAEDPADQSLPFVLFAEVDALAGGREGTRTDFYIGQDGVIQRSRYALSGRLSSLVSATVSTPAAQPVAQAACEAQPGKRDQDGGDQFLLPSYHPAQVHVVYRLPRCGLRYWETLSEHLSGSEQTLKRSVKQTFDQARLRDADKGLYALVIPISADINQFPPDLVVDEATLDAQPWLRAVFARIAAMVRIADTDQPQLVAEGIMLEPGVPLLVAHSGLVYMLAAYWLPPDAAP